MWSELLFAVNSNWTEIAVAVKLKILATLPWTAREFTTHIPFETKARIIQSKTWHDYKSEKEWHYEHNLRNKAIHSQHSITYSSELKVN